MHKCAICGQWSDSDVDDEAFCGICEEKYQSSYVSYRPANNHPDICLCYGCVGDNG